MPLSCVPRSCLLDNGHYRVELTPEGAGRSMWDWLALTRWGNDPLEDNEGFFVFVRDLDSGRIWPVAARPGPAPRAMRESGLTQSRVVFGCAAEGFDARLEVAVHAREAAEWRSLSLNNTGARALRLEVTGYLEVVLHHPAADASHPAFAKLFVQTSIDAATGHLLASRRPRGQGESFPQMICGLLGPGVLQWETDRMRFIGRGRCLADAAALVSGRLSGTVGNVLDPVFALRRSVALAPGETARLDFWLAIAPERDEALALGRRIEDAIRRNAWPNAHLLPRDFAPTPRSPPQESASGRAHAAVLPHSVPCPEEGLTFWNGHGGFSASGAEYIIHLPVEAGRLKHPPLPWINVLANRDDGFLISETGAGYQWSGNSREHRLSPWFNDPVLDPHGEALYLRDEEAGVFWTPMPGPVPAGAYRVTHGFGFTRFQHTSSGLEQETTLFMAPDSPVRITLLSLHNVGERPRALSVFSYSRPVLGSAHQDGPLPLSFIWHADAAVLSATSDHSGPFAGRVLFAGLGGVDAAEVRFTTDRAAFLGEGGVSAPEALRGAAHLEGVSAAPDSCLALNACMRLAPGETKVLVQFQGSCQTTGEALRLARTWASPVAAQRGLDAVRKFWVDFLGAVVVHTPQARIDHYVNGWAAYQNLACRIWARSAFYQSGGAFGFRDQLQDAAALLHFDPRLTREQILLHAAHQFSAGDVLHWWHPKPLEKGLRTRFADDLCWLPLALGEYVAATGDAAILDEPVPFLSARVLAQDEDEAYLDPVPAGETASLYEHACRALEKGLTQGAHDLPLFGTGDWNDGMSRVGREGRGESVWMGFFLCRVLEVFAPLSAARGDEARAGAFQDWRARYRTALETNAWDGAWYRRAWYDNGQVMGSAASDECRIDALVQAWAVISGVAAPERAALAMDSAGTHLISRQERLVRLLAPPFEHTPNDPGYIKGYVAGVRENGGQYTHAACWVVRALAELGRTTDAADLLEQLSPITHSATPEDAARYGLEPYVIAADIYGKEPHVGRGGWSWYTGSAGWYLRVTLESIFGLSLEGGSVLLIRPRIPDAWPEATVDYRIPGCTTRYRIRISNPAGRARHVVAVEVDGQTRPAVNGAARITAQRDGQRHDVLLTLG